MAKAKAKAESAVKAAPVVAFTRKARVTLPLLKQVENVAIMVLLTSVIHKEADKDAVVDAAGKVITPAKNGAHTVNVVDLETGELAVIILSAVTVAKICECYPENSYVGKALEIKILAKREGKKYRDVEIYELALPEGYVAPTL